MPGKTSLSRWRLHRHSQYSRAVLLEEISTLKHFIICKPARRLPRRNPSRRGTSRACAA